MSESGDKCQVDSKEDTLTSRHGHKLFCKYWKPVSSNNEKPKHLVFISHGVVEHLGRYDEIAIQLAQHNNYVFSHDHVGHGKSEGDRVHVTDYSIYVDDVIDHVEKIKKEYPEVPCFIFGHSMGGLITILTALKVPDLINGLILIGPAVIADKKTATPFKVFSAKVAGWIAPQLQLGKIESQYISRDKEICKQYDEDELVWHGGLKAKWACCTLASMNDAQQRFSEIKIPYLLMHGSADKVCHIDGSQLMHEKTSSEDKTLKVYEGGYHQIHFEIPEMREQVIKDIIQWIDKR